MPNWINVKEKLPEDRQEVLTYCPKINMIQLQTFYLNFAESSWFMHGHQNLTLNDITHWMELPQAPAPIFCDTCGKETKAGKYCSIECTKYETLE